VTDEKSRNARDRFENPCIDVPKMIVVLFSSQCCCFPSYEFGRPLNFALIKSVIYFMCLWLIHFFWKLKP